MNKPLYSQYKDGFYCGEHKLIFKDTCPKCLTSNYEQFPSNSKGYKSPRKYVRKAKNSIFERFHNFGVRFDAKVEWANLFQFEDKFLGRTIYKRIDFEQAIVKVFKRSILVTLRSCMDIRHLNVKEAEKQSYAVVKGIISQLPKAIVVSMPDVVNTHNAFVNHPIANHDIKVDINGQTRLISDHSKGYAELEAVNPKEAVSDSVLIEEDLRGLITTRLTREAIAESINALIDDRKYYAENLRSHVEAIKTLSKGIDIFNTQMEGKLASHATFSHHFSSPPENVEGDSSLNPQFTRSSPSTINKSNSRGVKALKLAGWL